MPLTERIRKWWFQTPAVVRGCLPYLQGAQAELSHQFLAVDTLVGFELRKPCGPRGLLGMTGPAHGCGWVPCGARRPSPLVQLFLAAAARAGVCLAEPLTAKGRNWGLRTPDVV
jgi:hypothetical protein